MTLSAAEREALGGVGESVDLDRVRILREPSSLVRTLVLGLSGQRAVTLGNVVFLPDGRDDIALLAHELTHCGQYQRWGALAYYGRGLFDRVRDVMHRTLGLGSGPYQYTADARPFGAYGMEQQGQIVEDCFNGNAAARTICPYHRDPAIHHACEAI